MFLVKDPASNLHNFTKLFEIVRSESGSSGSQLKLGALPKEKQTGPFVSEYEEFIKSSKDLQIVDAGHFYQELYVVKESADLVLLLCFSYQGARG